MHIAFTSTEYWGLLFLACTFFATLIGGLIGLKWKDKRHITLGFTAGVLVAVVAFDIFPEIFEMVTVNGFDIKTPMIALIAGFLIFHIAEKLLLIHHAHEGQYGAHKHPTVGVLSASALIAHSYIDGLGIGLGFHISIVTGFAIAIAVLAHDFSDGLNTVSLMLVHENSKKKAFYFLLFDAIAPVLGGLSVLFFTVSPFALVLYLGFFAGFLLYIGAADILPEAHSQDSSISTVVMTILGVLFVYLVTSI